MKVLRSFRNAIDEFVFAQPGEFFGEIYLSDNLVMDEVAGNLINRSVMTVIVRPKLEQTHSNRVYECEIKLKTPKLVVIKLNEVLCKDSVFEEDQIINIDLKFRYNRLPICEMHQAIDMCQQKIEILLPNVKNISYKHKVSNTVVEAHSNVLFKSPVLGIFSGEQSDVFVLIYDISSISICKTCQLFDTSYMRRSGMIGAFDLRLKHTVCNPRWL